MPQKLSRGTEVMFSLYLWWFSLACKGHVVGSAVMQLGSSSPSLPSSLPPQLESSQPRLQPKQQRSPCLSAGWFYAAFFKNRKITSRICCLQTE